MLVRPIDMNGMIQNTTQVSAEKTQDDVRPELQQNVMAETAQTKEATTTTTIHTNEELQKEALDPDREGEGGGYAPSEGQKKKKGKKVLSSGRIVKKGAPAPFDVRI